MVIVDDHLALLVLADALNEQELGGRPAITSLWYLRLVSAITRPVDGVSGPGSLRRLFEGIAEGAVEALRGRVLDPPRRVLEVLHLMDFAQEMAHVQRAHRVNLITAEAIGAAVHFNAPVTVAQPNAGGPLEATAADMGLDYRIRDA
ncbi:MAG: hypothetical protein M3Z84_00770 [Actinomycetota bacterium]|nr:hypothetical protein [Actinomycetota bacterium]